MFYEDCYHRNRVNGIAVKLVSVSPLCSSPTYEKGLNGQMAKRFIGIGLIAMLVVGMLAGCTSSSSSKSSSSSNPASSTDNVTTAVPSSGEKIKLSYMSWKNETEMTNIKKIADTFMKEHPNVEVDLQPVPYNEYLSKLNTLMAADQAPDVFYLPEFMDIDWGKKGVALDLAPYLQSSDLNNKLINQIVYRDGDKVWAIANGVGTLLMYYNKKLFQDAGIEPPSKDPLHPWTWDQFIAANKKLTTDQSGKHPGEQGFNANATKVFGTLPPTHWLSLMPLLYSNGARFATPDGMSLALNSPEAKQVLQSVADLSLVHKVAPSPIAVKSLPGATQMFKNNQLAMAIDGNWTLPDYVKQGIDIGVAPLPMFKEPKDIVWNSGYMVSKKSKHPEEAVQLLMKLIDFSNLPDLNVNTDLPNLMNWYTEKENFDKWTHSSGYFSNEDFKTMIGDTVLKTAVWPESVTLQDFGILIDQTASPELDRLWLGEAKLDDVLRTIDEKTKGKFKGVWIPAQ
jgi:multiple sugar transport system substrate-binding protein